jgi:hypothetical protein
LSSLEGTDYDDLLTYNRFYHPDGYAGSAQHLTDMQNALTNGESDSAKLSITERWLPESLHENFFRTRVAEQLAYSTCGPQCHEPGGYAASSIHLLTPSDNPDHITMNTAMYANLVATLGVQGILDEVLDRNHHLEFPLSSGTPEAEAFETFLHLLE